MSTSTIASKSREYTKEIKTLEQSVKDWEDTRAREVSEISEKCYDSFTDLQMSLAKLKKDGNLANYNKYQLLCYKSTCELLVLVENKVDINFCSMLLNKSRFFSKLINYYSDYCAKIEKEFDIELNSEKIWGSSQKTMDTLKKYLKDVQMPHHS